MSEKGKPLHQKSTETDSYTYIIKANFYLAWLLSAVMVALIISIQVSSVSAGKGFDLSSQKFDWALMSLAFNLTTLYISSRLLKRKTIKSVN